MKSFALLALTGLLPLASATPVTPARPAPRPSVKPRPVEPRQDNGNSTAPCARVSQAVYADGTRPASPTVPAALAYECINSLPLNATSAKNLLKSMPTYIQWQSTLNELKNPPAEYAEKVQPPVDILGGLEKLSADIDAGKFTSEYEFGWALYRLILSAHDGHFTYIPDSVGGIFSFGRNIPLVSVSEDGRKLPAIFAFDDVLGSQFKNITYTPSPVVEIDGQDVYKFLENWSQYGSLQDRDALYNNVFYSPAQISLGTSGSGTGTFSGGGRGRLVYPGPTTTLKFANGTEATIQNYARVLKSFRGINNADDLAKTWFVYGGAAAVSQVSEPAQAVVGGATPGYPPAVVAGPGNLINGFYIEDAGYEEYAVLQVPNFVGDVFAEIGFQQTTQRFIPQALADGKTKLIIDLQANGGGTILQGYDMFKQLFPQLDPYGAFRFRAHEAADLIGQSFSAYGSRFPRVANSNATIRPIQASFFDYHADMTVDGKPFSSWEEKYGPVQTRGGTHRINLVYPCIRRLLTFCRLLYYNRTMEPQRCLHSVQLRRHQRHGIWTSGQCFPNGTFQG